MRNRAIRGLAGLPLAGWAVLVFDLARHLAALTAAGRALDLGPIRVHDPSGPPG